METFSVSLQRIKNVKHLTRLGLEILSGLVIYLTFSCWSKMYLFLNFIYKVTITIFKEKYMQGFSLFSKPPVYKNIVGNTFDTGQV